MHGYKDVGFINDQTDPADMKIKTFTFNPFSENSYILYDETGSCAIVDPGCYNSTERNILSNFIQDEGLTPVLLLNTHCHIDHVFGNRYIHEKYDLELIAHEKEVPVLDASPRTAELYGLELTPSPAIGKLIKEGDKISFGNTTLEVIFTPGHSPGSVCFLNHDTHDMIAGDVLFFDSIGRTDLPGGHHQTLLDSISTKLLPLEDDWTVYCGHGPSTTIGRERRYNPFLRDL